MYMYLRSKQSKHGKIGTPYYIGKGCGNRKHDKQHSVALPANRANIVVVTFDLSERAAFDEERRLIAFYGRIDNGTGCLQNRTDGGEGASGHHYGFNETSFKSGHGASDETRAKLSVSAKERMTPKMRARISAKLKAIGAGAPIGNKHFAGHTHSAEAKAKIAQARKGIKFSPETIARMRVAATERCTFEVRARMSVAQRLRFGCVD